MSTAAVPLASASARVTLGANIYHHGARQQNRLLAECIAPLLAEIRRPGIPVRFWFDRFDARGPHLFTLFTVPAASGPPIQALLARAFEEYLSRQPSREALSSEKLEEYHAGCQGKALCQADTHLGIAANNSFCLFEQPADGYPFFLTRGLRDAEEIWQLRDALAVSVVDTLSTAAAGTAGVALEWVAQVDRALTALAADPGDYWHYHAGTLFFGIERLAAEPPEVFLASLARRVGAKNRETFSRVWRETALRPLPPAVHRLVAIVRGPPGGTPRERWAVLRDVVHTTLKQFGIPVPLHLPVVLFALLTHGMRRSGDEARTA